MSLLSTLCSQLSTSRYLPSEVVTGEEWLGSSCGEQGVANMSGYELSLPGKYLYIFILFIWMWYESRTLYWGCEVLWIILFIRIDSCSERERRRLFRSDGKYLVGMVVNLMLIRENCICYQHYALDHPPADIYHQRYCIYPWRRMTGVQVESRD